MSRQTPEEQFLSAVAKITTQPPFKNLPVEVLLDFAQKVRGLPLQGEPVTCRCPLHGEWISAGSVSDVALALDIALNGVTGAARRPSWIDIAHQLHSILKGDLGPLQQSIALFVRQQHDGRGEPIVVMPAWMWSLFSGTLKLMMHNKKDR